MATLKSFIESLNLGDEPINLASAPEIFRLALLGLDEFKGVKQINPIDIPIFRINSDTGELMKSFDNENYLGGKVSTESVVTVNCREGIEFNETVDIYSILLSPKVYNKLPETTEEKIGVHRYPKEYGQKIFFDYITIGYSIDNVASNEGLSVDEAKAVLKERILRKVSDALDLDESNLPFTRDVIIRCSSRSIKQKEN